MTPLGTLTYLLLSFPRMHLREDVVSIIERDVDQTMSHLELAF